MTPWLRPVGATLASLLFLSLSGCSSVHQISGDLYSIEGTSKREIYKEAYEFCSKRFPSQFMIRNWSGQGGFAPHPDPNKVELVFRCVTWSKDAPVPKRPEAPHLLHKPVGL